MGATLITRHGRGKNMADAFRKLQIDAEEEYGNDSYNGEINNCSLLGDVSNQRHKFDEDDHFEEWIYNNKISKRDAVGYCTQNPVANTNKIKTTVTNYPQKGTRKWETRYVAESLTSDKYIGISEKSQTDAIKKARAYVEKHPEVRLRINITKVLVGAETKVAAIEYKKAGKESDGHYTFIALAPE